MDNGGKSCGGGMLKNGWRKSCVWGKSCGGCGNIKYPQHHMVEKWKPNYRKLLQLMCTKNIHELRCDFVI